MPLDPIDYNLANKLIDYLNKQQEEGKLWVVCSIDTPFTGKWDLDCFESYIDALDFVYEHTVPFDTLIPVSIYEMQFMIRQASGLSSHFISEKLNGSEQAEYLKRGKKR